MYQKTIPAVLATDDKFAPYCSVAIASIIAQSSPDNFYDIYVFYDSLSEKNIAKLCSQAKANVSIQCISVTALMDKDVLYARGRISITTYLRLYIGEVLPQYDTIVYLDCDIIVNTDLARLLELDMGNNILGGVVVFRNTPEENKSKRAYLRKTLGMEPEQYINAGVLLINAKLFRQEEIRKKCMDTLAVRRDFLWMDQDVLNFVCKGRIEYLDSGWNTYYRYFERDLQSGAAQPGQFHILHYLDQGKPWAQLFIPSYIYFMEYIRSTPYCEQLTADLIRLNAEVPAVSATPAARAVPSGPETAVLDMYRTGKLGFRYILRYIKAWFAYKLRIKRS
ncbi:MAG: glycosyltransferase family 8 protein [Ruminococcaceae bacterium]|nr:glycosyltransferase family 8 protein [Oscillospiraceae bacterium]